MQKMMKVAALFAAVVLTAGFAACQEKMPSYLVVEDIDEDEFQGKAIMGVTDPAKVPEHMKIPNGIAGIASEAFKECASLKRVTLPKSMTAIGNSAFEDCTSLASVTIPNSVTVIGDNAFWGCTNLKDIQYNGTKAQWNAIKDDLGSYGTPIREIYDDMFWRADSVIIRCKDGDITADDIFADEATLEARLEESARILRELSR